MTSEIILIGLGQLGRIFAGGLLRTGHSLIPVNRQDNLAEIAAAHPNPLMVLVAVAENDLHPVLSALPAGWRDRAALLQNELLPRDWEQHKLLNPTVISVWFEKKKGTDAKALLPSPAFGPRATTLVKALQAIELPAVELPDNDALLYELVRKNLYILTTNIAGMRVGGNVAQLWQDHRALALQIAHEILDIQAWLTLWELPREQLIAGLQEAIQADPAHQCMGRSAPARLARALKLADEARLAVPTLRQLAKKNSL